MTFSEALQWRYATKRMNGQTVPQEKIDKILEAIQMAPTSSGLQPFEVIVISNPALKAQLKDEAAKQPQIVESSHVLVFAAWDAYTEERINAFFEFNNEVRDIPASQTDDYRKSLIKTFTSKTNEENFHHAAKQAGIALGFGLVAAALEEVDTTPMEGFDPAKVDEILGLKEKGLKSTLILSVGYRDAKNDWLEGMKKVRKPKEELFTVID
ncbi:NAD(P)H-dependent oxidoreductase [Roseivirga pacifica]|uniref:NAD(P)H-dependent oxidoreductase n=1 Tax=Roseivirga pacifica TaxID=1267423 RepID=UPI0020959971|nr:NAD(P)H-dependent oxidoreductase [Roseivirga pacifica]MCO6360457.1 NAD(P)H-dependent oxidoreductase [Roseivirga pacifica]MCO6368346.1 NAD(P)H-dependent oxidoreductase [Roseivirga pacifica]MCO6372488.1 NAD(P)H-dependent oxidoreductase [Roseivirga pacifica]MCO6376546.1 NAD(P)H-dependent oxidoreductase [Roseivirga pacifica]MCO6378174.1 NAD(P)H-dependent oxidoreductase [Roseivirga pacifica]